MSNPVVHVTTWDDEPVVLAVGVVGDTDPMATKDPERVRLGRLGALTLHASGKTNTGPARTAWEAKMAAEAGITDDLTPEERERRLGYAMRARMMRLNEARWGKKRGPAETKRQVLAVLVEEARQHRDEHRVNGGCRVCWAVNRYDALEVLEQAAD